MPIHLTLIILILAFLMGAAIGVGLHDQLVDLFRYGPDGRPENQDDSYSHFNETEIRALAQRLQIVGNSEMSYPELLVAIRNII